MIYSATPNLLIVGGAHVDRLARLHHEHLPRTSNPASISEHVGGGGFNAGRAAKRFDIDIALLSARGGDTNGTLVEEAIAAAGMTDLSAVHLDRSTPSYTALLQPDGELVTAIADMALYETAIARSFKRAPVQKAAEQAQAVLFDTNLNAASLMSLRNEIGHGKPLYALAISASKVLRLEPLLPQLDCLFMNRYEAAALAGVQEADIETYDLAAALRDKGLQRGVISAGGAAAALIDRKTTTLLSPPPVIVVDVTGAGDCLAGTIIAALLAGEDFIGAAKLGLCAASITASRYGACPDISRTEIEALAASHQWN